MKAIGTLFCHSSKTIIVNKGNCKEAMHVFSK
jgi:hypothetical protein